MNRDIIEWNDFLLLRFSFISILFDALGFSTSKKERNTLFSTCTSIIQPSIRWLISCPIDMHAFPVLDSARAFLQWALTCASVFPDSVGQLNETERLTNSPSRLWAPFTGGTIPPPSAVTGITGLPRFWNSWVNEERKRKIHKKLLSFKIFK